MIEGLAEYAGFLFLKRVAQVVAEFTGRTPTFPGEPGHQGWSRKVFFSRGVAGGEGHGELGHRDSVEAEHGRWSDIFQLF